MPYNIPKHDAHPRRHKCPRRGCQTLVLDSQFACPPCWHALHAPAQAAIWRTAGKHVLNPERRAAFRAADESWAKSWPSVYAAGTI